MTRVLKEEGIRTQTRTRDDAVRTQGEHGCPHTRREASGGTRPAGPCLPRIGLQGREASICHSAPSPRSGCCPMAARAQGYPGKRNGPAGRAPRRRGPCRTLCPNFRPPVRSGQSRVPAVTPEASRGKRVDAAPGSDRTIPARKARPATSKRHDRCQMLGRHTLSRQPRKVFLEFCN